MPAETKYPEVEVELVGEDGNACLILGRVSKAMKRAGISKAEIGAFYIEATCGDYDDLLATCARWVTLS
jgi:hypothetical protein